MYSLDIINKSDNKSFDLVRTMENLNVPGATTFVFKFISERANPLSLAERTSKPITWTGGTDAVATMNVEISDIVDANDDPFFGDEEEFLDGIATVIMTCNVTIGGGSPADLIVPVKKLFSMRVKEIIYRNACSFASEDILKSSERFTENLFKAYIKLKGMNSSAVTGLEDQLMINLEETQRLCLTME